MPHASTCRREPSANQNQEWEDFRARRGRYYVETLPPNSAIERLPKQYQAAHVFWAWIWLLSIPGCLLLALWKWWAALSVLILPEMIRKAVNRSAGQFVLEYAEENEEYFNFCRSNDIIKKL